MPIPDALDKAEFGRRPVWALPILAAATIACLGPFLGKAFCIDDPLFLWSARQIRVHPFDFFGFTVNWYYVPMPMFEITKNPPLACYFIALVSTVVGWSEPALHAAFLLPAIGTIWGTWYLARSQCRDPLSAALIALVSPVFLISSTNLMCDTMHLCFWVWALALWLEGTDSNSPVLLGAAAVLVAIAALTKYFGMSLIPLLGVHAILQKRRLTPQLLWLLIPIGILALYQWWTWRMYGRGLLSDAAAYATESRGQIGFPLSLKTMTVLACTFGTSLPLAFCAPWSWSKVWLVAIVALGLGIAWMLTLVTPQESPGLHLLGLYQGRNFRWSFACQAGCMASFGLLTLCLTLHDVWKHRTAASVTLALWVFGTFLFAGYVNWSCNGRSALPMAPAVGILLVRRLEGLRLAADRPSKWRSAWRWALVPAAAAALLVTWADYRLAGAAREAAANIAHSLRAADHTLWFEGHWGFQYYMEQEGAKIVDFSRLRFEPGDTLVLPVNNTNIVAPEQDMVELTKPFTVPTCSWLATMNMVVGAGFYSDIFGPMPFAFGRVPPEKYLTYRIVKRVHTDPPPDAKR